MTATKLSKGLAVRRNTKLEKRYLKYVEISPTQTNRHNSHSHGNGPLNNKTIAYNAIELKAIKENCNHVEHAKILPFGAITRIRELRINRNKVKSQ